MLRRLVYLSTAIPGLGVSDHAAILASARRHNQDHEITGFLLYLDNCFLQVLEGSAAEIDSAMERIRADSRHHGIIIAVDETAPTRLFPAWGMGFDRMTYGQLRTQALASGAFNAEELPEHLSLAALKAQAPALLSFLRAFYHSKPWVELAS